MMLSAEDIKILTLEKQLRQAANQCDKCPNGKERERFWNKAHSLFKQQEPLLFDSGGNYRKDKRHLLSGSCLDIDLI